MHVKDAVNENGNLSFCLIGEGELPIDEVVLSLTSVNYNGYASIEWDPKWMPELDDMEIIFSHYVSFMARFGNTSRGKKNLFWNKTHTGNYVWKKETLIEKTFSQVLDEMVEILTAVKKYDDKAKAYAEKYGVFLGIENVGNKLTRDFLFRLSVAERLDNKTGHICNESAKKNNTRPTSELAEEIGHESIERRRAEEENYGGLHGLDIHRAGVAGDGDGSDQGGVADNGADSIAISHCAGTGQSTGSGDHDLRQSSADGYDGRADYNVRQVEALGDAGGAVHEPVAALDQQNQADGKEDDGNKHSADSPFRYFMLYLIIIA